MTEASKRSERLARACYPIFAGQPSDIVGAALVELVALHLACHIADNQAHTVLIRGELLAAFVKAVTDLVPVMEAMEVLPKASQEKR